MTSEKLFTLFNTYTKICQSFSSFPITWDSKRRQFKVTERSQLKSFFLSFTVMGLASLASVGIWMARWRNWKFSRGIPLWKIQFDIFLSVCIVGNWLVQILLLCSPSEVTSGVNSLLEIEKKLKITQQRKNKIVLERKERNFELLVDVANWILILSPFGIPLVTLTNMLVGTDPFLPYLECLFTFMAQGNVVPAWMHWVGWATRYFLLLIVMFEGIRCSGFGGGLAIIILRLITSVQRELGKVSFFPRFCSYYEQAQSAYSGVMRELDFLYTLGLSFGSAYGVYCSFGTIRLYALIPFHMHATLPIMALGSFVFLLYCVDVAAKINEECGSLIAERKVLMGLRRGSSHQKKVVMRKLKSYQALSIHCGLFNYKLFSIGKGTRAGVTWIWMDYTVNALLSLPK